MATDKLSDVALRPIKPRDKQFKLSDGGGLFLLVNPNGSRLWRLAVANGWAERDATADLKRALIAPNARAVQCLIESTGIPLVLFL